MSRCAGRTAYVPTRYGWRKIDAASGRRVYVRAADGTVHRVRGADGIAHVAGGDAVAVPVVVADREPDADAFADAPLVAAADARGRHGRAHMLADPVTAAELDDARLPAATFDPRPAGDNSWADDAGAVFGVEVTRADLAARCTAGNLDPQHGYGTVPTPDDAVAAVDAAMHCPLPPPDATLATIRADADSVAAMAVLTLRRAGWDVASDPVARGRVDLIASVDAGRDDPWHGPRAVFPDDGAVDLSPDDLQGPVAPVAAFLTDRSLPMDQRVAIAERWLLGREDEIDGFDDIAARLRDEARAAVDGSRVAPIADGAAAFVHSEHRHAVGIGYRYAPMVVAYNPEFRDRDGDTYEKYTIGVHDRGVDADVGALTTRLNEEEQRARDNGYERVGSHTTTGAPRNPDRVEAHLAELGFEPAGEEAADPNAPSGREVWGPARPDATIVKIARDDGAVAFYAASGDRLEDVDVALSAAGAAADARYNDHAVWGGSATIVGSPQGQSTALSPSDVEDAVAEAVRGRDIPAGDRSGWAPAAPSQPSNDDDPTSTPSILASALSRPVGDMPSSRREEMVAAGDAPSTAVALSADGDVVLAAAADADGTSVRRLRVDATGWVRDQRSGETVARVSLPDLLTLRTRATRRR